MLASQEHHTAEGHQEHHWRLPSAAVVAAAAIAAAAGAAAVASAAAAAATAGAAAASPAAAVAVPGAVLAPAGGHPAVAGKHLAAAHPAAEPNPAATLHQDSVWPAAVGPAASAFAEPMRPAEPVSTHHSPAGPWQFADDVACDKWSNYFKQNMA